MWADDILWFPLMLQKKRFLGYFKFQGHDLIVEHKLEEVNEVWQNHVLHISILLQMGCDQKCFEVGRKHNFAKILCLYLYVELV